MIPEAVLKNQLKYMLEKTDLKVGKKYEGKVRDNYTVGDKRILVTTDRISAFDRVLCCIPFKGQVLTQTAAFWFDKTKSILKNHMISMPDPNVIVGHECKPYPVEIIVRGYITGVTNTSAWYNCEKGVRDFCGNKLPEGLKKNQKFAKPIITPTTKASHGFHDESISGKEIVEKGLVPKDVYKKMEKVALELFEFGSKLVAKNNLILVDTKYEFADLNGELVLIDEIHTPDSSRFWIKNTYDELFSKGEEPQKLDKEYVRQYLAGKGFKGDGEIPQIPDEVKIEAARRYIQAYEMITGKAFEVRNEDVMKRIKKNLEKEKII